MATKKPQTASQKVPSTRFLSESLADKVQAQLEVAGNHIQIGIELLTDAHIPVAVNTRALLKRIQEARAALDRAEKSLG